MNLICCVMMLLGIYIRQAENAQCFSEFSPSTGICSDLLGEADVDDCCMNPSYGYTESDGVCKSCGPAAWTEWSPWSKCTVSCKEGVRQRQRKCYGIGVCLDPEDLGTFQTESCTEQNCCPVEGGWSEWGDWQPCSVTCENGIKKRQRTCTNPPPQCGASCNGPAEETADCSIEIVCPIHGGWSNWGSWGPCQGTCANEGREPPKQFRKRTCTNPPPSTVPRGRACEDSDTDSQSCTGLPFCQIDGNWGSWSEPTPCSVTCGIGRQTQRRLCDSPEPKYGGTQCHGSAQKNSVCTTSTPCPRNGVWTEWGPWGPCKPPSNRKITCKNREGTRRRIRNCEGTAFNGNPCDGEIVDHGDCYDIKGCPMKGVLSEWSRWSFCKPNCGPNSTQIREKVCVPDISGYSVRNINIFSGTPLFLCEDVKDEKETRECKNLPDC
ncbi:properdin-like [Paramisgurnus dabryanus]|uniref:properdin-like n=1 Tax=Paramisgurnus dabryanus TaxID=90735 RepID=UPI0031F3947F